MKETDRDLDHESSSSLDHDILELQKEEDSEEESLKNIHEEKSF